MGYELRIAAEVRLWLHDLRAADPGQARLVGEAVTALANAGPGLGPPLVTTVEGTCPAPDARAELDRSYQRQLKLLQRVRRSTADVATSRKRLELQVSQLETSVASLEQRHAESLHAGDQEVAQEAEARLRVARGYLAALRDDRSGVAAAEAELTAASQSLQRKVDAFRTREEAALKARFTAAEALLAISQAAREISEIGEQAGEPGETGEPADETGEPADETGEPLAALSAELRSATELEEDLLAAERQLGADGAVSPDGDASQAELLELRPGALASSDLRLLFAVDPPGTVVLLDAGWPARELDESEDLDDWYTESVEVARERLAEGLLTSYGEGMFVREFFPGEGPRIEAGAAALARQAHRHDLAELRQRAGLSQAQLAEAMSIPPEQIAAIERAGPGAREVGVLAAYVQALGGRLEIVADLGADRIALS